MKGNSPYAGEDPYIRIKFQMAGLKVVSYREKPLYVHTHNFWDVNYYYHLGRMYYSFGYDLPHMVYMMLYDLPRNLYKIFILASWMLSHLTRPVQQWDIHDWVQNFQKQSFRRHLHQHKLYIIKHLKVSLQKKPTG